MPCCPNLGTLLYLVTDRRLVLRLQHLGNFDFLVPSRLLNLISHVCNTQLAPIIHGTNVE